MAFRRIKFQPKQIWLIKDDDDGAIVNQASKKYLKNGD